MDSKQETEQSRLSCFARWDLYIYPDVPVTQYARSRQHLTPSCVPASVLFVFRLGAAAITTWILVD